MSGGTSWDAFNPAASVGMRTAGLTPAQPIGASKQIAPAVAGNDDDSPIPSGKILHPRSFTAPLLVLIVLTVGLAQASGSIRVGPIKASASAG